MAWLNLTMPNQTVKTALRLKRSNCPKWIFSRKTTIKFSCTYWPLSFCKIFKKFLRPIQSYEDVIFKPISPEQNFFGADHYYYFHQHIGPFHYGKFLKKFLEQIQSYEDPQVLGPKWSICPKEFFFFLKIINIILI